MRLVGEGGRIAGVELTHQGQTKIVRVGREVILAAGAINSPHLLQLSGIGDPALLAGHGIGVAHALPGVGENLQDHLQLRMIYKVTGLPTLNTSGNSLAGKASMALEYAPAAAGPMTMAPSQMGGFTRSSPEHATPNLEFHVQPLSLDKFGEPLHRFPAFTAAGLQSAAAEPRPCPAEERRSSAPRRRSSRTTSPRAADQRVAVDAIRLTRRIVLESRAYAPYRPREFRPGAASVTDADLAQAAGDIGTTIFHPVGTCRMGERCDGGGRSPLRSTALAGLRIADASIMPTITSGNTNSPTIMIAEKAADMILADVASAPADIVKWRFHVGHSGGKPFSPDGGV